MPEIARMSSSLPTSFGRLVNSASVTQRFSASSAIPTYISSHFNATIAGIESCSFYFTRSRYVTLYNQTIGFMITTLLVFLQLMYLTNDKETPYTTHPYTMRVAVFSAFMYYLACSVYLQYSLRQFSVSSPRCMVWSGHISGASLMSVFLPDWVRPLLYIVFGLISASEFLENFFVGEYGGAFGVQRRRIRQSWDDLRRLCSLERAHILPT